MANGKLARGNLMKVIDAPELGYFVTDEPYPRGELLVRQCCPAHLFLSTQLYGAPFACLCCHFLFCCVAIP